MLWTTSVVLSRNIDQHQHNLHEFVICLKGAVNIIINDEMHQLSTGDSVFIPAEYQHSIGIDQKNKTKLLFACIDPKSFDTLSNPANSQYLKALTKGDFLINNDLFKAQGSIQQMQKIAEEIETYPNSSSPLQTSLKENLYLQVLLMHISRAGYEHKNNAPSSLRITKAKNWINDNYTLAITLEMVANKVNISRSHFARQFRQHTGFSVIEYLLKVRCDAVAKLLASTNTDITKIAFASGFSNLSHFYRHFKRRYGITPSAFRQIIKHQGSTLSSELN